MTARRIALARLAACAAFSALPAIAQTTAKKAVRIGFLYFASRKSAVESGRYDLFMRSLRELGLVEGRDFTVDARYADGKAEALPGLVADLLKLNVALVVATGTPAYRALQKATRTMPVIMAAGGDPVADGFAQSLSRPGGNFTGVSNLATDVTPKVLEMLVGVAPKITRVGVFTNPANASHPGRVAKIRAAAQTLGVEIVKLEAKSVADVERAFEVMARERVQAFMLLGDTFLVQQGRQIAALAIEHRLPSIFSPEYPSDGGLLGYGNDPVDSFRRVAPYVDKILKGAKPSELAIEQPSKLEFVINLKTARAMGLQVPQSLLLRADRVIE
jgi:putative ABC transport system substrate-binding protein